MADDYISTAETFFPECTDPKCLRPRPHRCILPFQKEILETTAKYNCILGGYGSGKSIAAVTLCVLLSLGISGNRGVVLRQSYPKLHDSTERIFLEALARRQIKFRAYDHLAGFPHRIVLQHNESEIVFRDTKDPGKFLGPDYGWFYIDEANEQVRKLFIDLTGRLRLPQAKDHLRGILTSNPPPRNHWIADIFGIVPGTTIKTEIVDGEEISTQYKLMRVSTRVNPYLPKSYIADLLANNPASEVKRIVDGEYGFVFEGKPVYSPPFDFSQHVGDFPPLEGVVAVRAFDFGFHSPSVTWHQYPICKKNTIHWRIIHEYLGRDLDVEKLAETAIAETQIILPKHILGMVLDCGDHAGTQKTDKGTTSIARLRQAPYNLDVRYRHLPRIEPGLALIRRALAAPLCACGLPVVQIHRQCTYTIDGFAGGYHYPTIKPGMSDVSMSPYKDNVYDNVMDTIRYAGENFYRQLMLDPSLMESLMYTPGPKGKPLNPVAPWAWMERR